MSQTKVRDFKNKKKTQFTILQRKKDNAILEVERIMDGAIFYLDIPVPIVCPKNNQVISIKHFYHDLICVDYVIEETFFNKDGLLDMKRIKFGIMEINDIHVPEYAKECVKLEPLNNK